jgi:hypothetical protein
MSAPNKATEMVAEMAIVFYESMDFGEDIVLSADDVQDFMEDYATDILGCEIGDVYDDEPFPEWTTLVATRAIASTIDYNWVAERVNERLAIND